MGGEVLVCAHQPKHIYIYRVSMGLTDQVQEWVDLQNTNISHRD